MNDSYELIKQAYAYGASIALAEAGYPDHEAAAGGEKLASFEMQKIAEEEEEEGDSSSLMRSLGGAGIGALGGAALGAGGGALAGKLSKSNLLGRLLKGTTGRAPTAKSPFPPAADVPPSGMQELLAKLRGLPGVSQAGGAMGQAGGAIGGAAGRVGETLGKIPGASRAGGAISGAAGSVGGAIGGIPGNIAQMSREALLPGNIGHIERALAGSSALGAGAGGALGGLGGGLYGGMTE
jgi:hypothetical protein